MVFSSQFSISTPTGLSANCLFICMELSLFESAGAHTGGRGARRWRGRGKGGGRFLAMVGKKKKTGVKTPKIRGQYRAKPFVPAALRVCRVSDKSELKPSRCQVFSRMPVVREAVTHTCRRFEPRVLQLQGQTPPTPLSHVISESGPPLCLCFCLGIFRAAHECDTRPERIHSN